MLTRFTSTGATRVIVTGILCLSAGVVPAAQREHSGTETFAAPDGTRVVIDTATVDIRLRAADVTGIEVATELRISGVGEERAERFISSHIPTTEVTDGRITITVNPGRFGFLGLGTLTARARLGFSCARRFHANGRGGGRTRRRCMARG